MILCVNLNAAIDKTLVVPNFRLNDIHRPQQVLALAGGKGCNVARAIKSLGGQCVVTGWVGGLAGQFIEESAKSEGLETAFVHTRSESRTCLSILDPVNGTLTELYEQGNPVTASEIDEFVVWFRKHVSRYAAVTFSGSLPPGVPLDFYAGLIEIANAARVPTFLDTGGEALKRGIGAKPVLAKLNKSEFEEWVGKRLDTMDDVKREVFAYSRHHGMTVVVTLGARGALCVQKDQVLWAEPPTVEAVSAVGSGDTLLAGLALGIEQSLSLEDSLRQGVAAGAANAMTLGAGVFAQADLAHTWHNTRLVKLNVMV